MMMKVIGASMELYRISNRILYGSKLVGYRVTTLDNRQKTLDVSHEQAIGMAKQDLFDNAYYDKKAGRLRGDFNTDLRRLPSIQTKPKEAKPLSKTARDRLKSEKIQLEKYLLKLSITGKPRFKYEELSDGTLRLTSIESNGSTGRYVVPYFISSIAPKAFANTRFSEVIIQNRANRPFICEAAFMGCKSTNLKVVFTHPEEIVSLARMFSNCELLVNLELPNLHTPKNISLDGTFSDCIRIQQLDLSHFDTSNVYSMMFTFKNCRSLKQLNISNWDTRKVRNMTGMFMGCSELVSLDLSSFRPVQVHMFNNMFRNCSKLIELKIPNFGCVSNAPGNMFAGCNSLMHVRSSESVNLAYEARLGWKI